MEIGRPTASGDFVMDTFVVNYDSTVNDDITGKVNESSIGDEVEVPLTNLEPGNPINVAVYAASAGILSAERETESCITGEVLVVNKR